MDATDGTCCAGGAWHGMDRSVERARREARAIIDAAADAMVLVSPDERIATVNRPFAALLGRSSEQLTGQPVADLAADLEHQFGDAELLSWTPAGGDDHATSV